MKQPFSLHRFNIYINFKKQLHCYKNLDKSKSKALEYTFNQLIIYLFIVCFEKNLLCNMNIYYTKAHCLP